jgi:hypothetical protein
MVHRKQSSIRARQKGRPMTQDHIARRADIAARYNLTGGESVFVDQLAALGSGKHARPITRSDFFAYDEGKFLPIVRAEIDRRNAA